MTIFCRNTDYGIEMNAYGNILKVDIVDWVIDDTNGITITDPQGVVQINSAPANQFRFVGGGDLLGVDNAATKTRIEKTPEAIDALKLKNFPEAVDAALEAGNSERAVITGVTHKTDITAATAFLFSALDRVVTTQWPPLLSVDNTMVVDTAFVLKIVIDAVVPVSGGANKLFSGYCAVLEGDTTSTYVSGTTPEVFNRGYDVGPVHRAVLELSVLRTTEGLAIKHVTGGFTTIGDNSNDPASTLDESALVTTAFVGGGAIDICPSLTMSSGPDVAVTISSISVKPL